jgi:exosortase E/protease (VPEID-CTERM system)
VNTSPSVYQGIGAPMSLASRVGLIMLLLFLEKSALGFLVDSASMQHEAGLGAGVWELQHWSLRFIETLAIALLAFCFVGHKEALTHVNVAVRGTAVRLPWLVLHAALVLTLIPLLSFLYSSARDHLPVLDVLCVLVTLGVVTTLFAAMAPWTDWLSGARAIGTVWLYSALAATAATCAIEWSQRLWEPTATLTFRLVHLVLRPLLPDLTSDPVNRVLDTGRFAVQIADVCSGLEGVALMLVFWCAWLIYFRREYVFPRALILIPAGLVLIFAYNVLRIAALVLIGHLGFPAVAATGFHSQAGWIGFNCVAGAIVFFSHRSTWLTTDVGQPTLRAADNPTAAYLMPLLAMLAAGMVVRATSNGFEALYGLELVAGTLALAAYWPRLTASLDWHFSWRAFIAGVVAFGIWMLGSDSLAGPSAIPTALGDMSPWERDLWIVARLAGSIVLAPIAEELAFRGYLLRRLQAPDFESVRFGAVGVLGLLGSSIVFGLLHGSMWLAGTATGVIYGVLLRRTERIGEATCAHAITNGLIGLLVLLGGQWQLW